MQLKPRYVNYTPKEYLMSGIRLQSQDEMLRVEGLVVKYADKVAVDSLSFSVSTGTVYGLLGPNGAGKSSTIRAIVGLVQKAAGSIKILGRDVDEDPVWVKSNIGLVPENPVLLDSLTPNEFFELIASVRRLKDTRRMKSLVNAFEFEEFMDTPIASLSLGNKQKCAVIAALAHDPKLLILDEPFNGLDVRSVRIFKDIITKHAASGGAVLFSTHIMEVAEKICNRVGIIDRGVKVAEGTMEGLKETMHGSSLEEVFLKVTNMEKEIEEVLKALE
ncbi:MAG: ABC transporter ATP-binding protein [Conexivisphaerales archaeon]